MREGAEREPYLWATVPSGNVGVSVDGLRLGVVGVEEANELRGTQIRIAVPSTWKTGDQKSLAVEWAPVGAKKCLVARVEILMGENEPKMTSFLVEDLDEVLELSD